MSYMLPSPHLIPEPWCMPACLYDCSVLIWFRFSVSVSAFWFRSSGWLSVMMTITVRWLFCLVLFWLNCFGLNRWTVLICMNWVDLTSLWTEMIDSIWFWLDLIWFDWLSRLSILCAVSVFFHVCSVGAIISTSTTILGGVVLPSTGIHFSFQFSNRSLMHAYLSVVSSSSFSSSFYFFLFFFLT